MQTEHGAVVLTTEFHQPWGCWLVRAGGRSKVATSPHSEADALARAREQVDCAWALPSDGYLALWSADSAHWRAEHSAPARPRPRFLALRRLLHAL